MDSNTCSDQLQNKIDLCWDQRTKREVTIEPIENKENDQIVSLLKKLPAISYTIFKPEPVFKVPLTPIAQTIADNKTPMKGNSFNKPKGMPVKSPTNDGRLKQPLRSPNERTATPSRPALKARSVIPPPRSHKERATTPSRSLKQSVRTPSRLSKEQHCPPTSAASAKVPLGAVVLLKDKQSATDAKKETNGKYAGVSQMKMLGNSLEQFDVQQKAPTTPPEKDNVPRTSSPNGHVADDNRRSKSGSSSISNNYTLMDLSFNGQIGIVPVPNPWDLNDTSVPEYDKFVSGIGDTTPSPCSSSIDCSVSGLLGGTVSESGSLGGGQEPLPSFCDIERSLIGNGILPAGNDSSGQNVFQTTAGDDQHVLQKIRSRFCDFSDPPDCHGETLAQQPSQAMGKRSATQDGPSKRPKLDEVNNYDDL
ncbi:uncharacterized protein LOC126839313 isoform X2 [Adelges cooleyi]|nr:uncharacterized protein LOC126839313 isoform X2 [Adelges cooleyi]XP_050430533.1 uncharacterized protein LOC126839313 isoform X2 [Adelges cooleyi]XP_050430534.1 uncharacterized protein LOC126839313 isoform X2 [Adelges cooleyi]